MDATGYHKHAASIDLSALSAAYQVRQLTKSDVARIYGLCVENPLFYRHCPPFVTRESILADMRALPPGTAEDDKYYVGFFRDGALIAVLDLILRYPESSSVWIGFFMMARAEQGKGIGSALVNECLRYLGGRGYRTACLGYARGNPQSEAFWIKNGFIKTGRETNCGGYTAVVMQRRLP